MGYRSVGSCHGVHLSGFEAPMEGSPGALAQLDRMLWIPLFDSASGLAP